MQVGLPIFATCTGKYRLVPNTGTVILISPYLLVSGVTQYRIAYTGVQWPRVLP